MKKQILAGAAVRQLRRRCRRRCCCCRRRRRRRFPLHSRPSICFVVVMAQQQQQGKCLYTSASSDVQRAPYKLAKQEDRTEDTPLRQR